MADNRIAFFNFLNPRELGFDTTNTRTLQQARIESKRYRDTFRAYLQDTGTDPNADNSLYRVSNIQEIAKVTSGSNYSFAHCFIIRDLLNNREFMVLYNLATFHFTTGAWSAQTNFSLGNQLNGATASWTTDTIFGYTFNSSSIVWAAIQSNSWPWQDTWIIPNKDYATSTWGGSWEYPTFASAYTLDFIRAGSFGANVISGDPASSGPNPVTAGAGNFTDWWPASFSTKNGYGYTNGSYPSITNPSTMVIPHLDYWLFDKAEKTVGMLTGQPHSTWRLRWINFGEVFDTFANGGLANAVDTKPDGIIVIDINLGSSSVTDPSNAMILRRFHGFRDNGTTKDSTMVLALNGDRTYANYKNGSDEIFTRKVSVSNGFTVKGFLKPAVILEGGVNTTALTFAQGYYGYLMLNKLLEYPDADNPMIWYGIPYFLPWKKNVGSYFGLSVPGVP